LDVCHGGLGVGGRGGVVVGTEVLHDAVLCLQERSESVRQCSHGCEEEEVYTWSMATLYRRIVYKNAW